MKPMKPIPILVSGLSFFLYNSVKRYPNKIGNIKIERFISSRSWPIIYSVSKIPKILTPKIKTNDLFKLTSEFLNKSMYSFKLKIEIRLIIIIEVSRPNQIEPKITEIKMVPVIALKSILLIYKKVKSAKFNRHSLLN